MPHVKYSVAARAEAVALAEVLGLSAASEQLGIDERTVAEWMRKAGRSPADAIEPASWERVARLALAKAEVIIASGKLSPAQLINAASMAEARAAERPKADGPDPWDFLDVLSDDALIVVIRAMDHLVETDRWESAVPLPAPPTDEAMESWRDWVTAVQAAYSEAEAQGLVAAARERERVARLRAEVLVREAGMRPHEALPFVLTNLMDDYEVTP